MSSKMNAAVSALMVLRVLDAIKGASEPVLAVVVADLERELAARREKRQAKVEKKDLAA